MYTRFVFICDACGHGNQVSPSPRKAYTRVLRDPRITCVHCKHKFDAAAEELLQRSPLARQVHAAMAEVETTTLATEEVATPA